MAITNRGYVDTVMEAATAAGARGGTLIHARGLGTEEAGKFFGITLQPEKDIVMILVPQKKKTEIMQAVGKAAGMLTKAHGILFSLPVEDFGGIA
jgi:nitrogen regulatory protein PII